LLIAYAVVHGTSFGIPHSSHLPVVSSHWLQPVHAVMELSQLGFDFPSASL
jgi:hypothetical protein